VAGLIDHGILVAVDVVVLYFTLRMTGLTASEWSVLPLAPLLAFLAFVKIAYFGTFTVVGGQTIGKMATRLQVVSDDFSAVSVSRSLWRSAASLASVVSFGAGLLPILLGRDSRISRAADPTVCRKRIRRRLCVVRFGFRCRHAALHFEI